MGKLPVQNTLGLINEKIRFFFILSPETGICLKNIWSVSIYANILLKVAKKISTTLQHRFFKSYSIGSSF